MMRDAAFEDQGRLAAPARRAAPNRTAPTLRRPAAARSGRGSLSFPGVARRDRPSKGARMTRTTRIDPHARRCWPRSPSPLVLGGGLLASRPTSHAAETPEPPTAALPGHDHRRRRPHRRRSKPSPSASSRSPRRTPRSLVRARRWATASSASRPTTTTRPRSPTSRRWATSPAPTSRRSPPPTPTSILATTGVQADVITKLEELGRDRASPSIPQTLDGVYEDITEIGQATGERR